MAGEARRLTKRVVDAAIPRAERFHLWDSELAGFGLRVEASGTKSFIVRYRAEGGGRNAPRRFMTVGRYGALTPDEARSKAREILGAVATGHDPASERSAKRTAMLVAELIELYAAEGCVVQRGKRQGQPMKAVTKRYTLARLRHHVVPILGRKRANEIQAGDIERLVAAIEVGKTAKDETLGPRQRIIVRGGPGAARKVARDVSAMFTFAVRRRLATENPCAAAAINKTDNRRTRFLDLGEVRKLGAVLVDMEARGLNPKAANIARLWALTGFRRNEAAGLKRSEVEWERARVVFGDSKTGLSVRPLGAPVLALLASIPETADSDFFFPAERAGATFYTGTKRVWPEAIRLAGLAGKVTPHTLRHSLGSAAVSSGESLKLAGALLGHVTVAATNVYAHLQHDPSVTVADRVSGSIAAALAGEGDGRVIPLRRGAAGR